MSKFPLRRSPELKFPSVKFRDINVTRKSSKNLPQPSQGEESWYVLGPSWSYRAVAFCFLCYDAFTFRNASPRLEEYAFAFGGFAGLPPLFLHRRSVWQPQTLYMTAAEDKISVKNGFFEKKNVNLHKILIIYL